MPEIFISSHGLGHQKLPDALRALAHAGIRNIELTGGTDPYEGLERDLMRLKSELRLNLRCHNYFPPPSDPFVLNLASLDDEMHQRSMDHCRRAIRLSSDLGSRQVGFHAGFLIDIKISEIGKFVENRALFNRQKSIARFCRSIEELSSYGASRGVEVFVENNVINRKTLGKFGGENPLLLCDEAGLYELKERVSFPLLLDVAHLKVSCKSLQRNFSSELLTLWEESEYVHISDNSGDVDSNDALVVGSELHDLLSHLDWRGKEITLEVYSGIEGIKQSLASVESLRLRST